MWGSSQDNTPLKADGTPDMRFKENQGASLEGATERFPWLKMSIWQLCVRWGKKFFIIYKEMLLVAILSYYILFRIIMLPIRWLLSLIGIKI